MAYTAEQKRILRAQKISEGKCGTCWRTRERMEVKECNSCIERGKRRVANPCPSRDIHGYGVMSFTEIGKALGISQQRAEQLYYSAVRKLMNRPETMNKLRDLSNWRQELTA